MKQNLLICLADPELQKSLTGKGDGLEFAIQELQDLPTVEQLGSLLPDLFLLDMDSLAEAGLYYLETIHESFPSIGIYILCDTRYQEEELFQTLLSGARGWLFKQDPEKTLQELQNLTEKGYFLKPFVSGLILKEFKNFSSGEPLLPVEEEIIRKSASGSTAPQIQKSLNLNRKFLRSHWESIWQKLNINARAKAEVESRPAAAEAPLEAEPQKEPAGAQVEPPAAEIAPPTKGSTRETSPPEKGQENFQLVTFHLGAEEFALHITQLQEIQRLLPITAIPRLPEFVEGIVNLRGRIVPILDLRKRLGLPASTLTKDARIMVITVEDKTIGMIVDGVREVLRIESGAVEPPPPLVLSMDVDYIEGVINLEERLILLLNASKIVSREEKAAASGAE